MKHYFVSLVATIALLLGINEVIYATTYSGSCGPNAQWKYNSESKTLSITGSGPMNDFYNDSDIPWYDYHFDIQNVTISNGITKIGKSAFQFFRHVSYIDIPNSVTYIGEYAFWGWNELTSIWIPGSVTHLDEGSFIYCEKLSAINISSSNPTYCSIDGVVFTKDKSKLILFPSGRTGYYTVPNNVTKIGKNAFYTSLISFVSMSNSVVEIEAWAFSYTKNLTHITLSNKIRVLEGRTFSRAEALTSITIPSSVTTIKSNTFNDCNALTDAYIQSSSGRVEIASDAFPSTTKLHFSASSSSSASSTANNQTSKSSNSQPKKKTTPPADTKKGLTKDPNYNNETSSGKSGLSKPSPQNNTKKGLTK